MTPLKINLPETELLQNKNCFCKNSFKLSSHTYFTIGCEYISGIAEFWL